VDGEREVSSPPLFAYEGNLSPINSTISLLMASPRERESK